MAAMMDLAILFLFAAVTTDEPVPALLQASRNAVEKVDECLQGTAERLNGTKDSWEAKYQAYLNSCFKERQAALELSLQWEWSRAQPKMYEERWQAARAASNRVDSRLRIWATRVLDTAPLMD
jgi:hypothetical protein